MTHKKCTFPKLGVRYYHFKKNRKGKTAKQWSETRQEILKKNPLW
jgi:hypothetical protein